MDDRTRAIVKASIRSLAAAAPVAAQLAQVWNEYDSYVQSKRIEEFFRVFQRAVQSLQERLNLVECHLTKVNDFAELLERSIEKIQREPSETKRRLFAWALANGLAAASSQTFDIKASVIETLDTLIESDLDKLRAFSSGRRMQVDQLLSDSQFYRDEEALGEAGWPLIVSLSKLESRGLIGETVPVNRGFNYPGEATHWINRWRRKTFELTPFGKVLLESISEPEQGLKLAESPEK